MFRVSSILYSLSPSSSLFRKLSVLKFVIAVVLALGFQGANIEVAHADSCSASGTGIGVPHSSLYMHGGFGNAGNILDAEDFLENLGLSNVSLVEKVDGITTNSCNKPNDIVQAVHIQGDKSKGFWQSDGTPICALAIHAGGGTNVRFYLYDPAQTSGQWETDQAGNP